MGVDVQAQQGVQHATSTALSHAKAQEQSHASSYATAQGNESTAAQQFTQQAMKSDDKGLQKQVMEATGGSTNFESSKDIAHQFGSTHGLTDAQSARVLASASAGARGGFEFLGNGVHTSVDAKASGDTSSTEQASYENAIKSGAAAKYGQSVQTEHKLAEVASHNMTSSGSESAAKSLSDAHKQTETEQQQWGEASKQVDQLQKAEQYTSSKGFSTNTNMNQYLEDYMRDQGMAAGVYDQGLRTKTANTEGFAEYALNRSGIQTDLNNDGKTDGWNQDMDEQAKHTGEHTPHVQAASTAVDQGAAAKAATDANMTPGQAPETPTSQKVDQKLEDGEKQAEKDRKAVVDGQQDVSKKHDQVEGNVSGQSTHLAGRVAETAIHEATGYAKEAVTSAMDAAGFDVDIKARDDDNPVSSKTGTHTIETVTGEGPTMGDGMHGMGKVEVTEMNDTKNHGKPNTHEPENQSEATVSNLPQDNHNTPKPNGDGLPDPDGND